MLASEGLQRIKQRVSREAPRRKVQRSRTSKLIMWAIVLYLAFLFGSQEYKILQVKQEKTRTEQQIVVYRAKNDLLREQIKYLSSSEFVEKAAREQLGFIRAGEVPYITKSRPAQEQPAKPH